MPGKKPASGAEGDLKLVRRKAPENKNAAPQLSKIRIQKQGGDEKPSLLIFTLLVLYKNLYILGIALLRRKRRYGKRIRLFFSRIRGSFLAAFYNIGRAMGRFWENARKSLKAPFLLIGNVYREQKPVIASKRSRRKFPMASYLQVMEAVARLFTRIIKTLLNYIVPLCAAAVLLFLVNGFFNQSFGLEVVYEGRNIGYIKSESDFNAAVRDVKSRIIVGGASYSTSVPSFELVVCVDPHISSQWMMFYNQLLQNVGFKLVELDSFTPIPDLATSIIQVSGMEVVDAYGFYIDNRLYGVVTDKSTVLNALEVKKVLASSGKPGEKLSFDKSIALTPGIYPLSSVVEAESIIQLINSQENVEQTYTVEEGDTPTGIADKQGISYELLREINPSIEGKLMVGDQLVTAVARSFLSVKSTFTDVYLEEIPYTVVENKNAIYAAGYSVTTREGVNGMRQVTADITVVNGIEIERKELDSVVLSAPISKQVTVGVTLPRASGGTSSGSVSDTGFIWPIRTGKVSVGFAGYAGHTGIDIAGDYGDPILASASGTVTLTKYSYYGYGIHLKIDHGNGYETLYAHCSALYVNVGDYVQQGQIIAARGSTGNSTGNHLHFEVIKNKSAQNPRIYVSP